MEISNVLLIYQISEDEILRPLKKMEIKHFDLLGYINIRNVPDI